MPRQRAYQRDSFVVRLLPKRHILIKAGAGYRTFTISPKAQLVTLLAIYLSTTAAAFGTTGYMSGQVRLAEQGQRLAALERVTDGTRRSRSSTETRLRQMISELDRMGTQQQATIESLTELQTGLEGELETARRELDAVTRERDAARAASLAQGPAVERPESVDSDVGTLAQRIAGLEAELLATASARDRLKRTENGLRWRVELLENRLGEMRRGVSAEASRVRSWILGQVSALEQVLETSGVDVDRLIERVDTTLSSGQGGPLEPIPLDPPRGSAPAVFQPQLREEMSRLRAVNALLQVMPLVAPMEAYRTTSGFGVRRDPITNRPAMHSGLDFGGPDNANILSTAPGRVVSAGPAGAYGNMVELDHGMGITTRYGHLKKVLVKSGQRVALHAPVGIMGSTGRSTGEHLHYEVRVDGVPYDPGQFLEAGRHLGNVFKR